MSLRDGLADERFISQRTAYMPQANALYFQSQCREPPSTRGRSTIPEMLKPNQYVNRFLIENIGFKKNWVGVISYMQI
jgi:hypothetical protein